MESIKTIFVNSLKESKNSADIASTIRDLTFEISCKKLQNLSNEENIQTKIARLFEAFTQALNEADLKDSNSITAVIDGLTKAVSDEKKQCLLKTIYEKERLEASIYKQSNDIKLLVTKTYDAIESTLENAKDSDKLQISKSLSDAKLLNVQMLGILKEAAEEAFVTTIEKARDIRDTTREISKTFTYQAINESKFTKVSILNIANALIEAAKDIADSDHANANDILRGAIEGVKEGISKAMAKFKSEIRFAPDEVKEFLEHEVSQNPKDMINMEEYFIDALKQCLSKSEGVSAKILTQVIAEHNTYLAKAKRLGSEAAEALNTKIENLKDEGLKEIKEKAGKRFEEIKKGASEKVAALKTDAAPRAKQIAKEVKDLGFRAWEAAKNALEDVTKIGDKK
jgi:hypothetical protein